MKTALLDVVSLDLEHSQDPTLQRFREQYDLLKRALASSREREDELIKQCRSLKKEIVNVNTNLEIALKTTAHQDDKIKELTLLHARGLKREVVAKEKEKAAQELIIKLRDKVRMLMKQARHIQHSSSQIIALNSSTTSSQGHRHYGAKNGKQLGRQNFGFNSSNGSSVKSGGGKFISF